jgi:hypothetical protein
MNIREIKEWAETPGLEVFTSECEEIGWLISQAEKYAWMLSNSGNIYIETKKFDWTGGPPADMDKVILGELQRV